MALFIQQRLGTVSTCHQRSLSFHMPCTQALGEPKYKDALWQ